MAPRAPTTALCPPPSSRGAGGRARLDAWVRRLNRLARELDADAAAVFPSAWAELPALAAWRRAARSAP